ncbi:MAG: GDSL-type esterase/lipase family protein [Faecalibacterium sp.]
MADYQEYRRRVLHRRWRKVFITATLLVLLVLLAMVSVLWKSLRRAPSQSGVQTATILQKEQKGTDWNTLSYVPARHIKVHTLENRQTAADFRMISVPASAAVEKSFFSQACFLGDSLTQGMQLYDTGLPNARFCAYKGIGPNAVVNGTLCRRADGEQEVPLDVLRVQQPKVLYVLLGTNVLGRDADYSGFLTYYRLMLDMLAQELPKTTIYVQSITPVRPKVSEEENHAGLNRDRLCSINNELAAVALEKNCCFLNLWEALADENGDLKAEYAQPDGYHLTPEGYAAWVEYLRTHIAS